MFGREPEQWCQGDNRYSVFVRTFVVVEALS